LAYLSQSEAAKMLNVSERQADILMEQGRGNIKTPLPIMDKRVSEEPKHDTRKKDSNFDSAKRRIGKHGHAAI